MGVAAGPALVWTLEDRAAWTMARYAATAAYWNMPTDALSEVYLCTAEDSGPLWCSNDYAPGGRTYSTTRSRSTAEARSNDYPPGEAGPTRHMAALAADVRLLQPRLVIIDPISVAVLVKGNDLGTVRAFAATLANMIGRRGAVLFVGHSTKQARAERDTGPGIISGSAGWWDACRTVIAALRPEPEYPNTKQKTSPEQR